MINIKELISVTPSTKDHYSVAVILQLKEGTKILVEKEVSIPVFRYEAKSLKQAIKDKARAIGQEWEKQSAESVAVAKELAGLVGAVDA